MLKPLGRYILTRSPHVWLLGWTMCVGALPATGWAESLPASVRACAAEQEPSQRLACYDREVARFQEMARPNTSSGARKVESGPSQELKSAPPEPQSAAQVTPNRAAPSNPPVGEPPAARTPSSAPPPTANQLNPTPTNSEKASGHLSGRVVSIDRTPNEMVLHLDNGQVWEELQSTSGDLSLQVGDSVKIDKHLGSYWLSGPHVSGMKVRQKT